jgi:hypothetical protein
MSQENVEIVRRVGEVWNESGWRGVIDQGLLHPEVEYHDDPKWPDARSTYGTEALIKRSDEFLEAFGEDASTTTEQVLDAGGDRVVIIFHFSVRGPAASRTTTAGASCAVSARAGSPSSRHTWSRIRPSQPPGSRSRPHFCKQKSLSLSRESRSALIRPQS